MARRAGGNRQQVVQEQRFGFEWCGGGFGLWGWTAAAGQLSFIRVRGDDSRVCRPDAICHGVHHRICSGDEAGAADMDVVVAALGAAAKF